MLKKFSILFVLLFGYFVCICDVFADAYCTILDESPTFSYGCTYKDLSSPQIRNHVVHHGYGPRGSSEWTDLNIIDYSNSTNVYNYNLFGYYQSGNLIPYSEPNHNYYEYAIDLSSTREVYTDDNGNVEYYTFYAATDYVDISFGSNFAPWVSNRLDFAIHINFNSIPDSIRKAIMGSFTVDPVMPTIGGSYCDSSYESSNELIRVSCSFDYKGEDVVVRLKNLNNIDTNFNDSVNSYHYYMYFDISAYESVWTIDNRIENLQTTGSPNGTKFDLDYNYYTKNGSYFSSFSDNNFNGLTSVITAPLRLLSNLDPENEDALEFTIFRKRIFLPTGYELFWGKCAQVGECSRPFRSRYIGKNFTTAIQQYSTFNTFRIFWRTVFGGFLIYITALKLFKVILNALNPNDVRMEEF